MNKITFVFLLICGLFFSQEMPNTKSWEDDYVRADLPKEKLYDLSNKLFANFQKKIGKDNICNRQEDFNIFLDEINIRDSVKITKYYENIKADIKSKLYDYVLIKDNSQKQNQIQILLTKYNIKENEKYSFSDLNENNYFEKISMVEKAYSILQKYNINEGKLFRFFCKELTNRRCKDEILDKYIDSKKCFDDLKMISEKSNVNYYLQYKKLNDKTEKKDFIVNILEIIEQSN